MSVVDKPAPHLVNAYLRGTSVKRLLLATAEALVLAAAARLALAGCGSAQHRSQAAEFKAWYDGPGQQVIANNGAFQISQTPALLRQTVKNPPPVDARQWLGQ